MNSGRLNDGGTPAISDLALSELAASYAVSRCWSPLAIPEGAVSQGLDGVSDTRELIWQRSITTDLEKPKQCTADREFRGRADHGADCRGVGIKFYIALKPFFIIISHQLRLTTCGLIPQALSP